MQTLEEQRKYKREYMRKWSALNRERILERKKLDRLQNPEKYKKWKHDEYLRHKSAINKKNLDNYYKNKDSRLAKSKQYQQEHHDEICAQRRQKYQLQKEILKPIFKQYYEDNKGKIITRQVRRNRLRKQTDVQFKLKCALRRRLGNTLKGGQRGGSFIHDLGCSIAYLQTYLESKFQEGMTWKNYGFYGWHLDHIIPLDRFDLTNREEFLKACHYTNLQPMWGSENMSKGSKLI